MKNQFKAETLFMKELFRKLEQHGYTAVRNDSIPGETFIEKEGHPLCSISTDGKLSIKSDSYEELSSIMDITKQVSEYVRLFNNAESNQTDSADKFRVVNQFNDHVLCMRINNNDEIQFATFKEPQSENEALFNSGNYFDDYTLAKEDFAVRAGLVDSRKVFSETELKVIFSSLASVVDQAEDVKSNHYDAALSVVSKIRDLIPEIENEAEFLKSQDIESELDL